MRAPTTAAFRAPRSVSPRTKFVLHQLFGPVHHCNDLVWRWVIDFYPQRFLGIVRTRRIAAHLGVALDHLSLTRECGPDVLRIRVGTNAGRNGFPGNFPG